jgi:hypothetical protein
MHSTIVTIPVQGQQVVHHCDHELTPAASYRVVMPGEFQDPTYLRGTLTEMVGFGEQVIRAALEHAAPDTTTPAEVWLDYLTVRVDLAQAEVRAERAAQKAAS